MPPLPAAALGVLACPVCGAGFADAGGQLRCAAGHVVDRARQGHVTLLPPAGARHHGDSAAMVAARADFLAAGYFAGVTRALGDAVLAEGTPRTVLDLGGGTGQHLAAVLDRAPDAVGIGLDASRYAARRAAKAHPRAMAVVADTWSDLPVRTGSVDRVLVVFAPRNGPEMARVLAPGGRLVVVAPAADHLAELVDPLGLLEVDPDKTARLAASLHPWLTPVAADPHREVLELGHAAVSTLVRMGPHARHLAPGALEHRLAGLPDPIAVTVAVQVSTHAVGQLM